MTASPVSPPAARAAAPVLSDAGFAAVASYLARSAGLVFDESRRPALAAVISERLVASGAADVGAYLARVASSAGVAERQELIDAVVVPETHFFRNPPQMVALRRRILPELMRRAAARGRPLTVWSAGCSTGEEPYSLAMLAGEVAAELPVAPAVRILATDISARAVATARRGHYTGRSLALVTPEARERWFEPEGAGWRVVDDARSVVDVRLHNLVTEPPPFAPGEVDLLVCRNVTIYFGRDTTRGLVETFHDVLTPGGYLLVGHAETLWQVNDDFTLVALGDAFAYRRDGGAVVGSGSIDAVRGTSDASGAEVAGRSDQARPLPRRTRATGSLRAQLRGEPPRSERRRPTADGGPSDAGAAPGSAAVVAARQSPAPAPDPAAAPVLLAAAREALQGARYAEAARLASRAGIAAPLEPAACIVEGRARATVGDDEGALTALRRAVSLDPSAGHARFLLAGALARTGQGVAAAREYRAAAIVLPHTPAEDLDDLLDGCDVAALVALCARLAEESDRAPSGGRR